MINPRTWKTALLYLALALSMEQITAHPHPGTDKLEAILTKRPVKTQRRCFSDIPRRIILLAIYEDFFQGRQRTQQAPAPFGKTYVVNNTKNNPTVAGSLPWAIAQSNAQPRDMSSCVNDVVFAIDEAEFDKTTGAFVIRLDNPIEITAPVRVHGYTQQGSKHNTLTVAGTNAKPKIMVQANSMDTDCFVITQADNSAISGLIINHSKNGITINNAKNTMIAGNFIGVNATGKSATQLREVLVPVQVVHCGTVVTEERPVFVAENCKCATGVLIENDAPNNKIGGSTAAARNIISNNDYGIYVSGEYSINNSACANLIGLDATATTTLANQVATIFFSIADPGMNDMDNNLFGENP